MTVQSSQHDKLRKEGDYYVDYVDIVAFNGKSYSIANQMVELAFHENVLTPSMYMSITLYDVVDFPTLLPIIGEERVKISFTRQKEGKDSGFREFITLDLPIYKITNRAPEPGRGKGQIYTLHAVSDETIKALQSKVYLGLVDKKYSDMVDRVYKDYIKVKKPIDIERTKHLQNYCISNMPPMRFISMVASSSISEEWGGCAFFFYETRDKFHFESLGKLFSKTPTFKLNFAAKNIDKVGSPGAVTEANLERDIYRVHSFQHQGFDLIKTILTGAYSSKAYFIDPIRQIFTVKEFDLDKEWASLPHVDKSKPFTPNTPLKGKPTSRVMLHYTDAEHDTIEHIAAMQPSLNPKRIEDYVQRVNCQLDIMMRHAIDIVVPGTPEFKAGETIEFALPESLGRVSPEYPEEKDKYLQGKYLILSVMHRIHDSEYSCGLTLIKDSFFSDIRHRDPHKEYPAREIY